MTIVVFSSRFLYLPPTPAYSETAAEIFCLTIWSGGFCFILGYISIFTCVSLTIERWIAVVKPNTYRSVKPKHGVVAVILAWICGIAVSASTFFRLKYDPDKITCRWMHAFAFRSDRSSMDRFNSAVNHSFHHHGGVVYSYLFPNEESTSNFFKSRFPTQKGHSCSSVGMLGYDYRMASRSDHIHVIKVWLP